MNLVNLTPHSITIAFAGQKVTIPPSGTVARVEMEQVERGIRVIDGLHVPVHANVPKAVIGLPEPQSGVGYLVSAVVLAAVSERDDVFAPDTTNAARNEQGHIVSVPGLVCG